MKGVSKMEDLNEILQRLTRIETKLDIITDHEKRIRFLERYAFALLGIVSIISIIIQIVLKKI
jgi:uncharacterized membrane protein YfbV (UPF0208 family)